LAILVLCLAYLGSRVAGLHFHVADAPDHHGSSAAQYGAHHGAHHDHSVSHVTSDLTVDHFTGHASQHESDVGSGKGLIAKLPAPGLSFLLLVFWLGFALTPRLSGGLRVPVQWMRPPDLRRWPILLLPPSQGPPRAA
jgi:hypothetical protein